MALYTLTSNDEFAKIKRLPSADQTRLYNALGRDSGSAQTSNDNFFVKKGKSLENALGTTAAAAIGGINEAIVNNNRDNMMKDNQTRMNEIAKKYGYNTYHDVWDARDKAEAEGDQATLDFINNTINPELQRQATTNKNKMDKFASDYKDYVQNDYIGQKTNQDQGKFLGSAINTMSTATDVLGLTNGPLSNAIQGGIEGVADELEQSGFKDFSWERAGQNALTGAASGAVTGALNAKINGALAKRGGNLLKGGNKLTQAINNFNATNPVGQLASSLGTGAARGAISGAVGGATGAGLSAAMNNQDVLGSALQGAKQGAISGAGTGAIMTGANMAIDKTPGVGKFLRNVNQAQQDWQNSGDNFRERFNNTRTENDTWGNRFINNRIEDANAVKNGFQNVGEGLGILAERGLDKASGAIDTLRESPLGNIGMGVRDVNTEGLNNGTATMGAQDFTGENIADTATGTNGATGISATRPETEIYRRLMGKQTAPKMDSWDNLAKEKGFANYDEATQRFTQANPGAEPTAENVTDWMDGNYGRKNATSVNESIAKQKLKDIKADAAEERAAKDLLNQVGTATAPAARADNMVENVKAFMKEGLTKPEEWQLVSDAITGANGTFSKLFRNLVSQAGEIDTFTGLGGKYGSNLEDTIDYYIKNAGLTGNSAKGVKNEIVGIIESLPSRAEGSLSMSDSAEDVMGAVRKLEARKRNYMGEDSRNHQNTDPYKTAKAEAIGEVASMLESKIYDKLPDARSVVTPEAIQELKSIMPNNEKWAQSVDEKFANIKTGKDLRAVQKRYVQTSDYLTNVRKNYGTYGQKVGDAYGNALSQGLKKIPVVGGLLAQATDTPFMNRRYADINMARAAKLRGEKIDLPSNTKVKVDAGNVEPNVAMNTQTEVPNIQSEMPTNNATMMTVGAEAYNPSMNIYNAIGRNEGRDNAQQARTADYLVNAAQEAEVVNDNTGVGTTMDPRSTSLYNTLYGQTGNSTNSGANGAIPTFNSIEEERAVYFFPPTGDYWSDMLSRAMRRAKNAEDYSAMEQLYSMYQDQLSNLSKSQEKDYSNPVNWNSTDRKSLLQAQNGLDQIDELEASYNDAVGSGGGNLFQGTLRQWSNNISGGNLDPSADEYVKQANSLGAGIIKNLVNLGSTEYDAQRYIDYLPKLTDTKEQASRKLQKLKNAYQNVIENLQGIYNA